VSAQRNLSSNDSLGQTLVIWKAPAASPHPSTGHSKRSFSGYLKGFAIEVERAGIVSMGLTIKVSGKPTYTAAA
jgi:hypothetical protein